MFHPRAVTGLSKYQFLGDILSSHILEPQEKQWLVHLYRSTRPYRKRHRI